MHRWSASLVLVALLLGSCSEVPFGAAEPETPVDVWAIGDSIMVGAEGHLATLVPDILIDAEVGRPFGEALPVLERMIATGGTPDALVIALGTNAGVTSRQIDELLLLIGDQTEVILVNVRVPQDWEDSANYVIAEGANRHDNVVIVDWHAQSEGLSGHLRSDGYHPNDTGSQLWANLIVAELRN